jgi:hypothetical protein
MDVGRSQRSVYLKLGKGEDEGMNAGRLLIATGLAIAGLGLLVMLAAKLNLRFGRMPGDIVWHTKNTTLIFPWVSCLVLSVVGTLLWWLITRQR